jgi:hypothetical protein
VKGRIPADVVLEILRCGHWSPLGVGCDGGAQHTIMCDRLERWRLL